MGTISVNHLGKAYKQYPTRWSRLREWLTPGKRRYHQLKWVLKDISFTVRPGEAVGIIGINGAGKSTLLKLITGTTQPTTGSVAMTGRVAAMLELGMGFHPDFTGRQNVLMAGQLLGLSAEEISRLMPEIEAFAEIGDYIDQPVRVYSSGMQVRLAFSVATAVRPDVLIVDEALSVGDAYFQHKSFNRIKKFREKGTTLLIVSHDKSSIQSLCDRAILINNGELEKEGSPEAVMDYYHALLLDRHNATVVQKVFEGRVATESGTKKMEFTDIFLVDENSKPVNFVNVGQKVTLNVELRANSQIEDYVFGFSVRDRHGQLIFGTNSSLKKMDLKPLKLGETTKISAGFECNFGPGTYSIQVAVINEKAREIESYDWRDLALIFDVLNINKEAFVGLCWLDSNIRVN